MDGLLSALRSYQQADEEGIMCIVSRQAVEEAADEIERLRAALASIHDLTLNGASHGLGDRIYGLTSAALNPQR